MIYPVENTNFMTWRDQFNPNDHTNYAVNFSGNPKRDNRHGSYVRKAAVIIPENLAEEFRAYGLWVGMTKPPEKEEEGYTPTYYTWVKLSYNPDFREEDQPRVFIVTPGAPAMLLKEDSVSIIDELADGKKIESVDIDIKRSFNKKSQQWNLFVDVMYVNKKNDQRDSFKDKYRTDSAPVDTGEEAPF